MAKQSLIEAFNVKPRKLDAKMVKDYDIFPDKELLDSLRSKIIQDLIDNNIPEDKMLEQYINDEIDKMLVGYDLGYLERNHIFNLIQNEVNGYGPINDLLEDDSITEIMVNGINEVYVEIDGKIVKDDSVSFINDDHIIRTIQRIVQPLGRTIDAANPMVDARLRDGSRLNAIIPPLSLKGPVLTIRKFAKELESIDQLLLKGTLTNDMAKFLEACVQGKVNIIISGGTGTGKTTLLRDIVRNISNGISSLKFKGLTVGVVDERGEIAAMYKGIPQNDVGTRTDIIDNMPKAEAMRILVRSMSPNVIACDEIGSMEDINAIDYAMCSGVKGIFTAHGKDLEEVSKNPELSKLLNKNIFERIILLNPQMRGDTKCIYM